MAFVMRALLDWRASDRTKLLVVVGGVIALSVGQTMWASRNTKDGHALMSSEKPQALRREAERDLAEERAKLEASVAAAAARR